jgi:uncharacterized protein YidB (DUF937 family)
MPFHRRGVEQSGAGVGSTPTRMEVVMGSSLGAQTAGESTVASVNELLDQFGGLDGIIQKLEDSGLGDQLSSWIGKGDNLPVSADQIKGALSGAGWTRSRTSWALTSMWLPASSPRCYRRRWTR